MMKKFASFFLILILISLILILISCSKPETVYNVDISVQPYLADFYVISGTYGKTWSMDNLIVKITPNLVKSKGGIGATTIHKENGYIGQITIEFDLDFWNKSSESVRSVLSLHEFGHAFLKRQHTNGYSIMNPAMGGIGWPKCQGQECDHKFLLDELFNGSN